MPNAENDWVRLPGVFHWSEVRDVLLPHAGGDEEWRFVVKPCSVISTLEPLYAVHAKEAVRPLI